MKKRWEQDGITVIVEKKNIKNMYLRLKPPDGAVYITAPVRMPDRAIRAFVEERRGWILARQEQLRQRAGQAPRLLETGELIPVWGERCWLQVTEGKTAQLTRMGEVLLLQAPAGSTPDQRQTILENWYRSQLTAAVPAVLERCQARTSLQANEWHIKRMKTRWGSCNISARRIWLSLELVKYPPACLEMVITHELVHLLERGHSQRFYALMDRFLPDWRQADQILRRGILESSN